MFKWGLRQREGCVPLLRHLKVPDVSLPCPRAKLQEQLQVEQPAAELMVSADSFLWQMHDNTLQDEKH